MVLFAFNDAFMFPRYSVFSVSVEQFAVKFASEC